MKLHNEDTNFLTTGELSNLINVSIRTILRHPNDYPPLFRIREKSNRYAVTDDVNAFIQSRGQFKTVEELKQSQI